MARGGHKFNAKRTDCSEGHSHPSAAEARRCSELHLLQRAGHITRLVIQPQYWFEIKGVPIKHDNGRRVGYKPDWKYFEGDLSVVEECKGFRTADYPLRKAIFKAFYPYITFRETGR